MIGLLLLSYPGEKARTPTSTSLGTRCPLRWRATRDSRPPTQVPPMKTAGAREEGEGEPSSAAGGRAEISWSSNSMTVGWTPIVARSFFMTWHMQQEDREKMITGCSDISRWILVSVDSAPSMDKEEEFGGVVRSRRTTSLEQRRRSRCIARTGIEREMKCWCCGGRKRVVGASWCQRGEQVGAYRGRSVYIYKWKGRKEEGRRWGCLHHIVLCLQLQITKSFAFFLSFFRDQCLREFILLFQAHAPTLLS